MIRNVIFIILFVILYGGAYLLLDNSNNQTLTDRNEYGEFTGHTYNCNRFSVKMEYDEDWLVFDGVSMEQALNATYSHKEIEGMYGSVIDSIKFVGGAVTPRAYILCAAVTGENVSESELNGTSMETTLSYMKEGITGQGGTMGDAICYSVDVKGTGNKMIVYGYDYTLNGEQYSNFSCITNTGEDTLIFSGKYEDSEGLKQLTDFVENKLYFYSAA